MQDQDHLGEGVIRDNAIQYNICFSIPSKAISNIPGTEVAENLLLCIIEKRTPYVNEILYGVRLDGILRAVKSYVYVVVLLSYRKRKE
jgi:hypothetical protein